LITDLESLVDPVTRGDPESSLRWTTKSTRKLAAEVTERGTPISPQKAGELLFAVADPVCDVCTPRARARRR
jgi:hypothetical protein